jgi:hypothetical protein
MSMNYNVLSPAIQLVSNSVVTWFWPPEPKMENRSSTRLPTRSRLPTASTSLAATSASTAKRTASTAQLDGEIEHALTRRKAKVEAFSASMTKNSLERRAADAEQAKRMVEADLTKVKQEKDKVERDRRWFAQREKDILEERDAERAAFEKERVSRVPFETAFWLGRNNLALIL